MSDACDRKKSAQIVALIVFAFFNFLLFFKIGSAFHNSRAYISTKHNCTDINNGNYTATLCE